jgi:alkylation response protein AidB-like acyl-CoA dehydrogenase
MNAIAMARPSTQRDLMLAMPADLESTLDRLAAEDDRTDSAPIDALKYLVHCGAATAVLPASLGGAEFGWSRHASPSLGEWLRRLGASHLSLARLYEGHVNAFQLIWTYGNRAQRDAVSRHVAEGGWLGVWNAPHPTGPLRLSDSDEAYVLDGHKAYASGAGLINRPLVTAQHERLGYVMVWPAVACQVGAREEWEMHGMRASVTLPIRYHAASVAPDAIIGADNDYHREPMFSAGAWRFLAAQFGAGERLGRLAALALTRAGRDGDPHQRARMADVAIAVESAALWVERARWAADSDASCAEIIHIVRMARLAVERQLLEVIQWVHRSVGLAAFRRDNPIERITRDLETYLRQPVPDLVRDRIGEHMLSFAVRP